MTNSFEFSCPVCECRLTATQDQVGQTIVCPDCLEAVFVPQPPESPSGPKPAGSDTVSSAPNSPAPNDLAQGEASAAPPAPEPPSGGDAAPEEDGYRLADDDDELRLAPPEPRPGVEHFVTRSDVDVNALRGTPEKEPARPAPPPKPSASPPLRVFTIRCDVCETRIDVRESDIGRTVHCPDCGTAMTVEAPRPEQVQTVSLDDLEGGDLKLTEAAPVPVYQEMVKEAEQKVLREEQEQRERGRRPEPVPLPAKPLLHGVADIFKDVATWGILIVLTVMIFVQSALATYTLELQAKEDSLTILVIGMGALSTAFSLFALIFGFALLLLVLTETADGYNQIREFIDFFAFEWLTDGLFCVAALAYSVLPAVILTQVTCIPMIGGVILALISAWLLFPVIFLSMQETTSWMGLYSPEIFRTLREHQRKWMLFYGETAVLGIVSLPLFLVKLSIMWLIVPSVLTAVAAVLYFRILGRLTLWVAQSPPETPHADESLPDAP